MSDRIKLKLAMIGKGSNAYLTPSYFTNGHWLVKRARLASKVLRAGELADVTELLKNQCPVYEETDTWAWKVIPQSTHFRGIRMVGTEESEKTLAIFTDVPCTQCKHAKHPGQCRDDCGCMCDLKTLPGKNDTVVGFNLDYIDALQLRDCTLLGKDRAEAWKLADDSVVLMPRRR